MSCYYKIIERVVTVQDKLWFVKCRTCDFEWQLPENVNLHWRYDKKPTPKQEESHRVTCPNCQDSWIIYHGGDEPTRPHKHYRTQCPNCLGVWMVKE